MSNMHNGLVRMVLPAIIAAALCAQSAQADIYTWVDASGTINVSNIAPPDGVSVKHVVHTRVPAGDPAAHDAQVQALMQRVGQLEDAVESAERQPPPPMAYPYPPVPQAPLVQYIVNVAPPVSYEVSAPSPSPAAGCDPSWTDCGSGWMPGFYPTFFPAGLVVLRPPFFPRARPIQGGHQFATQQPMFAPVGGSRRG
jgi:hypothetical protein